MQQTPNLLLKLPEPTDFVQVEDLNENFTKIDTEIAKITDEETGVEAKLAKHLDHDNNPHGVTAEQVGAVKKSGDTMTGLLRVPAIHMPNGTRIQEAVGLRTVINAHNNRLDVVSEDGNKPLYRWVNGDFYANDENGNVIESFKSIKQKLGTYETGVWTPVLRGSTTAGSPVYVRRIGEYIRHNNLLYVRGEILLSSKGGMTGNLEISGLPIVTKGSYRVATIGVHNQVNYPTNAKGMSGYIDSNIMRPYFNITGTGNELLRVTANDVSDAFLITFTATYDI